MKVDDAPVFIKSISALLILTSVIELLTLFITVLNSNYLKTSNIDKIILLLIQSVYCFIMIWFVYGLMIRNKWCYLGWLIMAVLNIIWLIIDFNELFKYVLIALLLIDIALLSVYPRSRSYCLSKDISPDCEERLAE